MKSIAHQSYADGHSPEPPPESHFPFHESRRSASNPHLRNNPRWRRSLLRPANEKRTSLHQEIELNAPPERIFDVLLDSKQFAAFTGMAATIDPSPGARSIHLAD